MSDEEEIPSPGEVLSNRREMNDPNIRRLREKFVKALNKSYNGKDDVLIDTAGFDNWVVDVVIQQFNRKGWTCWKDSDRDGYHVVFKAKLG